MIIVTVTAPRSGSHMLHSMLACDPHVLDVGCLFLGETTYDYKGSEYGIPAYIEIAQEHPDRIVAGNVKRCIDPIDVSNHEIIFIHQYRRNLLGLHASTLIAQKYDCWYAPPTGPVSVTFDKKETDEWTRLAREDFYRVRELLSDKRVIEIAYEDLNRESLAAALSSFGVNIAVGDPTTPKISPPYEECVTNWHDFEPSAYAMIAGLK